MNYDFKVGDKVKINYEAFAENGEESEGVLDYIYNNLNKVYKIKEILDYTEVCAIYVVDDNFLNKTSFYANELEIVKEE